MKTANRPPTVNLTLPQYCGREWWLSHGDCKLVNTEIVHTILTQAWRKMHFHALGSHPGILNH